MSAYRFVTLTCDECGEIFDEGMCLTFPEARKYARRYGWRNKGREDYCGPCLKEIAAEAAAKPSDSEKNPE